MLFQLTMILYITFTEYNITTVISKENTVFFYDSYRKIRTLKKIKSSQTDIIYIKINPLNKRVIIHAQIY